MGYFSNGTEGEAYYATYCAKCLHDRNQSCRVWLAHQLHNYKECNNEDSILHLLIPRSKDKLSNLKCKMFVENQKPYRLEDDEDLPLFAKGQP